MVFVTLKDILLATLFVILQSICQIVIQFIKFVKFQSISQAALTVVRMKQILFPLQKAPHENVHHCGHFGRTFACREDV